MKTVKQRVKGTVWQDNGRFALWLEDDTPDIATATGLVVLRHALVTTGRERHLFPTFLLDDWGNEVRGSKLYDWVRENGNAFPRAEIFGHMADGQAAQLFVRELEIYVKLPCYAFVDENATLNSGHLLQAILLPDASVTEPVRTKRPSVGSLKRPLAAARVQWWQVPLRLSAADFWAHMAAQNE